MKEGIPLQKSSAYSKTILSEVMLIDKANSQGNIHGGEIIKIMDSAAGVAARRHSRCAVVTARVDELEFRIPVHVGHLLTCTAELVFVGRSSMEILVTVDVEDLNSETAPRVALTGYFTMVALDRNHRPVEVPKLSLDTREIVQRFEEGRQRYEARKQMLRERGRQIT